MKLTSRKGRIVMIPVDKINILNPRVRNKKQYEAIANNVVQVGLKRPITVTTSKSNIPGKDYDLVCGQGRLEIFIACGQPEIPAVLIDVSGEEAMIMSIVQNKAAAKEITNIERNELPYPSLNEVNFLAFSETNEEYHNELYGFIEHEGWLADYKTGKKEIEYKKVKGGSIVTEKVIQSIYIRHQIHHPENTNNVRFTNEQLIESVNDMRTFICQKKALQNQRQAA